MTQTLFKRTSTGAIQIWRQEFNETGDGYRTISGQQGGAQVTSQYTIATPKNVGRSNATTPQQQAQAEVEANYKDKLDRGRYCRDVKDVDAPKYFAPMLAKKYEEYPPDARDYARGFFSQPKLDGCRCVTDDAGSWYRTGKPILSSPHIRHFLQPLFAQMPDIMFDGELYNHTLKHDFEILMSLARKVKNLTAQDIASAAAMLQYHVYDLPSHPGPFAERFGTLERIVNAFGHPSIVLVKTVQIHNQAEMDALNLEYSQDGYEGQILRRNARYQNKRTADLLKRKDFVDSEFIIKHIAEGEGNRTGQVGRVTLWHEDGVKTFGADILGNVAYRTLMFQRRARLIGKPATVKYFKFRTADNIPKWAKVKFIHEEEKV